MDWDDLRYVHAVRRSGSLGAAAKLLGVDKATVSRRIGGLERETGVRLFDRKPSGYAMTPHGERVVAAASAIDQRIAALEAELSEGRGDASGRVFVTLRSSSRARSCCLGLRNVKPDQMSVTTKRVVLGMALYASRGHIGRQGVR